MANDLDNPERIENLRATIAKKRVLRALYAEVYQKYAECLNRCPKEGKAIELGSGGGFVREIVPEVLTTDVLPYEGVDQVVDATKMPFADRSLRAILMLNVFHHIPDVAAFFAEAERCLVPGGRVLIVDQNKGWLSTPILKYAHHEPYNPAAREWKFESSGPLSGANGALAWIVFERDRARFESLFPHLEIVRIAAHTPLRYWLAGGLKSWSLLPMRAFRIASRVDAALSAASARWGSFVDIELVKV